MAITFAGTDALTQPCRPNPRTYVPFRSTTIGLGWQPWDYKSPTHNIGMISPIHRDKKATHQSLSCHVANAVVRPDGHSFPIRILNVLDKHIELCQGRKIAEFTPLVQSSSKQSSACCSVAFQTSHEFWETAAEMIDSSRRFVCIPRCF